ncbi:hypothetical protein [Longimicrobium terrae]|uniref:Uncharacterized protein n=1 Tax=Longimicrobium terrae TaxID=1639882 RepID=A0A841GVE9_9BACT|nr:hypothetical protein [Longimicrobium terrae]MBB4634888.1 hypothetical protein [Longimicrobium terrae]MBB6069283.1 hypothetical protein [Longimicrobium terrae]NNC31908.1 hypothetical protein [Longimicrobium terrae]
MRSSVVAAAALAAALITPRDARAQASPRDEIARLLGTASRGASQAGYRAEPRVFDVRSMTGMLPSGGSVVVDATLRAGARYMVVGVCDGECQDLDLRVNAPDGAEVLDEDVSDDDVPVLRFTATENGAHPLSVIMSDCRAELCRFAVKVLAQ